MSEDPTVPCKYCSTQTMMTGTRMCDRCWHVDQVFMLNINLEVVRVIAKHHGYDLVDTWAGTNLRGRAK